MYATSTTDLLLLLCFSFLDKRSKSSFFVFFNLREGYWRVGLNEGYNYFIGGILFREGVTIIIKQQYYSFEKIASCLSIFDFS